MAGIVSSCTGEMLMKDSVSTPSGCLLCNTEKNDSQKRTSFKGKVKICFTKRAANASDFPLILVQRSLL